MGKKLIYLNENPQICCENCLYDGIDCNANMLYVTCLSRGFCEYHGVIDPDEDFCYSEFEPNPCVTGMTSVTFPKRDMTEVPTDFLQHVYDEAFKAGANGMQELYDTKLAGLKTRGLPLVIYEKYDVERHFKGLITYHPEFVIQE